MHIGTRQTTVQNWNEVVSDFQCITNQRYDLFHLNYTLDSYRNFRVTFFTWVEYIILQYSHTSIHFSLISINSFTRYLFWNQFQCIILFIMLSMHEHSCLFPFLSFFSKSRAQRMLINRQIGTFFALTKVAMFRPVSLIRRTAFICEWKHT